MEALYSNVYQSFLNSDSSSAVHVRSLHGVSPCHMCERRVFEVLL